MAVAEMEQAEKRADTTPVDLKACVMEQVTVRVPSRYVKKTITQIAPHSFRVNLFKDSGKLDSYFIVVDDQGMVLSATPPLP